MSFRKYTFIIVAVAGIFFAVNMVLWHGFVKDSFGNAAQHGDLVRMGSYKMEPAETLPAKYKKKHMGMSEYLTKGADRHINILTIGDSFSNGHGGNHYQDYLEEAYGLRVLNIPLMFSATQLETLHYLEKVGFLQEIKPDIIILECVGRNVQEKFSENRKDWLNMPREKYENVFKPAASKAGAAASADSADVKSTKKLVPAIMFKANWRFLKAKFYVFTHKKRLSKDVFKLRLARDYFTNKTDEKTLLVYHEDMDYLKHGNQKIDTVHNNLNETAALVQAHGAKLVFLPMPDKLDLYNSVLVSEDKVQENNLFEKFSTAPSPQYLLLNSKALLKQALEKGEKDLYWADDTHCTWKAERLVCDELMSKLAVKKI